MVQFFETFSKAEIVHTLSAQLSWSHFKQLISLKDPLQREFYAQMCRIERWSVRELGSRIDSMLYQRTTLSNTKYQTYMDTINKSRHNNSVANLFWPFLLSRS